MNKFIFFSLLLVSELFVTSCNDDLDLKSDGSITMAEVFTDRNRTRGYLNGCYGFLPSPYLEAGSFTDDAEDSDDITPGSRYDYWYNGGVNATNFASYILDGSPWGNYYQGIRRCNVFIANIDEATAYATDAEKIGWKAQAYVLRAFYYLELFKRYGQVPLVLESRSADYDYTQDKKASIGEIVTQILSDCDTALATAESEDFPWRMMSNQWNMMTRAVAYAIKSQAITFAVSPLFDDGTFTIEQAVQITGDALSQCLNHGYTLFTTTDNYHNAYAYYFLYNPNDLGATDKETIYGGTQVSAWSDAGLPTTEGMTKAGPCPTQDLVDAYEMANGLAPILGYDDIDHLKPIINPNSGYDENNPYEGRDPRFYATIYFNGALRKLDGSSDQKIETFEGGTEGISTTSKMYTRTGYYMHKYAHFNSNRYSNSDGYMRIFRLPELYYNFAETAYQAYGPDKQIDLGNGISFSACGAINVVRARVGMPGFESGMSVDEFQKKYRNERRIEYAMEILRYFDVRRWKILNETERFVTGMRIVQKEDGSLSYQRFRFNDRASYEDRYLFYPLDVTEVDKMERLTGDDWQNLGW